MMRLQESIRRILREDYSPAGKEITPNEIVVHKSNPMFRDKIMSEGLKVRAGECYKIYVGYGTKCKPAIFATNSTNKRAWFDSTYDDDIWFIDTTKIPDVKWFKDRHFESRSKHIVTFQDIPKETITLKYKGTGSSEDILKSWPEDSPNNLQESIRRILRENSLKNDLMGLINNLGVKKASKAVGGFKNLFRILNINSPMDYLHLFDDLKIIPLSETEFRDGFFNDPDVDCYGYNPDKIIFIHFKDYGGEGRISYEEIWEILREEFGLSHEETVELTMEWLNSVFDLQVSNTFDDGY